MLQMKFFSTKITFLLLLTILTGPGSLEAARYKHRATRLGNPATRFAPTIHTIEDLRSRFRDPKLRPDIASICRQAGWTGDLEDLHHAALNFEIVPLEIPKGTIMPFMSSRKNGRPIALMDVLWAGEKPIQALAFDFISKGIRYKCITPKPCSNFFIDYVGPVISRLSLKCNSPERQFTDRPVKVCLTVSNTGEVTESPRVVLNLPNNAEPQTATDNGTQKRNHRLEVGRARPRSRQGGLRHLHFRQTGRSEVSRQGDRQSGRQGGMRNYDQDPWCVWAAH